MTNLQTFLIKYLLPPRRFSDSILATILATKSDMCGKKFELKIDNVRFVGHPTLLQHPGSVQVGKFPSVRQTNWVVLLKNLTNLLRGCQTNDSVVCVILPSNTFYLIRSPSPSLNSFVHVCIYIDKYLSVIC